jgi:hypothetical protein
VGGRSLRDGSYDPFSYFAAGYATESSPASEFGFAQIDVAANQLTVSYIAADNGAVIDQFMITDQQSQSSSVPRAAGSGGISATVAFVMPAINGPIEF